MRIDPTHAREVFPLAPEPTMRGRRSEEERLRAQRGEASSESAKGVKFKLSFATLYLHEAVLHSCNKWLFARHLSHRTRPLSTSMARNPG